MPLSVLHGVELQLKQGAEPAAVTQTLEHVAGSTKELKHQQGIAESSQQPLG